MIYARQFAIITPGQALTVRMYCKEREIAYANIYGSLKHWGERWDPIVKTHVIFFSILFVRYYEKVEYKSRLSFLMIY